MTARPSSADSAVRGLEAEQSVVTTELEAVEAQIVQAIDQDDGRALSKLRTQQERALHRLAGLRRDIQRAKQGERTRRRQKERATVLEGRPARQEALTAAAAKLSAWLAELPDLWAGYEAEARRADAWERERSSHHHRFYEHYQYPVGQTDNIPPLAYGLPDGLNANLRRVVEGYQQAIR